MMKLNTIRQIIDVLRGFRENYSNGMSLKRSYRKSVQRVANSEGVTYQTIADACRRRLRFNDIDEFHQLLATWMTGDHKELARQLKRNAYPNCHSEIDSFFGDDLAVVGEEKTLSKDRSLTEIKTDILSLRLPEKETRMLKALAEIEALSVGEYLAKMVSDSVRLKMKEFAHNVIREA